MSRQARVGLLVLAGFALFLVSLFAIANRSFLFSDIFAIQSEFRSVAGLVPGAPVQFQGVNVGRVEEVALPAEPGDPITVTMAIREAAHHLIRENTQAQIKSDGLVGNQIIVLVNPPEASLADPVEEGDFIPGVDPFDPFQVADRVVETVTTFEETAEAAQQIIVDVRGGEGTLGRLLYDPAIYNSTLQTADEAQRLMSSLSTNAEALVAVVDQASVGVNDLLLRVNEGEGSIPLLLNDPGVYERLLAASDTLLTVTGDLEAILSSTEHAAHWGALGAFRFAELMEAAKHNWLFKRYFEERGYVEQAPFEVRERAIEATYQEIELERRRLYEWEQRLEALEARLEEAAAEPGRRAALPPPAAPGAALPDTTAAAPVETGSQ